MKARKKLALLVVTVMLASFVVACGDTATDGGDGGTDVNMILATGGTTGTYYSLGGTLAQQFNTKVEGINVTAQSTGASVENCRLLGDNEAELALLQNDILDYAKNGTELFEGETIENLRAVATLYPEVIQIIASKDIKTIDDLRGKNVSVGSAGSGTEANARQILNASGITYEDISEVYLSFSESADAYKDGQVDAFFITAGVPNASIQDITAQHDINILQIDSASAQNLIADYPFYIEYTIPAGTYSGVDEDVDTVAVLATLATNAETDEETIYNITKALFDNLDELAGSHAKGAEITLEGAVEGLSIEFHPGAERYFKEVGILE